VDRAIEIVNRALEVFGPPIYVRHEVHNKFVVEDLRAVAPSLSKSWTRCRTTSSSSSVPTVFPRLCAPKLPAVA
jgi:4-hydroxy-3-methylbut-2-enyl diphosphate reductase IspH